MYDPLTEVPVERIHRAMLNPEGEVAVLQRRLQCIRSIDPVQYRKLKTALPYIVCAQFHPKIRRKENFLYTDRMLLDIDHLSEHGLDREALRKKLQADERVELLFASPGGDGLKLLFRIDPRISDSGYYTVFYKAFCREFSAAYQLGGALDQQTCDVTRCCFVSFDPDAWYNAAAVAVNPSRYVDEPMLLSPEQHPAEPGEQKEETGDAVNDIKRPRPGGTPEPGDEVMRQIKQALGQRVRQPREKFYEQPEKLQEILPAVTRALESAGAAVIRNEPIAYGRKLTVQAGEYWAEVNVFYGKRGVSIVGTSKTGSNRELCKLLTELLKAEFEQI